jgi:hypothetical protein
MSADGTTAKFTGVNQGAHGGTRSYRGRRQLAPRAGANSCACGPAASPEAATNVARGKLDIVREAHERLFLYDALSLFADATNRLMLVKGWQLARTYSVGAAQIMPKSQSCAIGRRVLFMGAQ